MIYGQILCFAFESSLFTSPTGTPSGKGYILPYVHCLVLIQIQYIPPLVKIQIQYLLPTVQSIWLTQFNHYLAAELNFGVIVQVFFLLFIKV